MSEHHQEKHLHNVPFRYLALTAAILTFIVISQGGILRAFNASGGNYTEFIPILNIAHQLGTLILFPLLLVMALEAWTLHRKEQIILLPSLAALALLGGQILLGGLVDGRNTTGNQSLAALHLGISLVILGLVLLAAVVDFYNIRLGTGSDQASHKSISYRSPFARLTLWTLLGVFTLLVSGAVVSATSSGLACPSWPFCSPASLFPAGLNAWINLAHRLVVVLAGLLVMAQFVQAWRTQRTQAPILVASTAGTVLFFSQALLGGLRVAQNFPIYMIALHEATAVAVWGAFVVQAVAAGMANRTSQEEQEEAVAWKGRKGVAKDLFLLTKPVVVLLLLVTTFAGMVIGRQAWPSFHLVFWTLLGGFLAAGGSGAINQYIDRCDDEKMQRTEKRPIPSGRMTPAEGLAFGVGIALVSFFLLVAFVNLLAALLSLAGILYYTLLYSIFLKKTTVQNIVIGGGAGAIPPLVGWAAATGSLNVPALFLFAIVFMWTPPHFWALAIVRRNDYARAGVPMLPVVHGERKTRWQIFLYTVQLVVLTLLLPLFGLGSSIYLISALLLGGWLLLAAYRVWKMNGNKVAWKMYRYSSMYLAFLFLALMVDRLIIH